MYGGIWEGKRVRERFMSYTEIWIWKGEGIDEQADVGGLLATHWHGIFRFWVGAKGHVWIHGSATAMVCIDVNGPCYHQVPWGCLGSGLPPVSTYEPKGTIVIWMPWAAAPSHGMIQAWALARVHVWIHDPTIARVYVDVHGTCYHWGFCGCTGSGLPLGIDWGPRAIL